jgi:hypothetical protein
VATEQDWVKDKTRFVADATDAHRQPTRDHGFPLGPLGQQFALLTYSLLDAETVDDVLNQVVQAAAGVVPQADVVSITLRTPDGRFHTPFMTDSTAEALDQAQYEAGEGPCVDAARPGGPAVAGWADLRVDPPWPVFARAAVAHGMAAVLSTALIPAPPPGRLSGALNLYARTPGGLDDVDRDLVLLLATHASLAAVATDAVTRERMREVQLRRAIDSRDVIGQAKGILMSRRGISADEAFDVLRRTSQDLNVKLVDLAETLASRHTELDSAPSV